MGGDMEFSESFKKQSAEAIAQYGQHVTIPPHEDPVAHSYNERISSWLLHLVCRVKALEDACHRHGIEVEEVKQP